LESSLAKRLQDLESEGTRDSEGAFTVDLATALSKLQRFQLAEPGGYLLGARQVVNALGCESASFKLGLRTTRVDFTLAYTESVSATSLAMALSGRANWASPAARHLGIALRAGLGGGAREVVWTLGTSDRLVLRPGSEAIVNSGPEEGMVRARIEFKRAGGLLQSIRARFSCEDHHSLCERSRFSKARVRLDGRDLEQGPMESPKEDRPWYWGRSEPYYLMKGFLGPATGLPEFHFPDVDLRKTALLGEGLYRSNEFKDCDDHYRLRGIRFGSKRPEPTLLHYFDENCQGSRVGECFSIGCGAAFDLHLTLSGPSTLTWVIDGVSLEPVPMNLGCPGLRCVASAEGLRVDLTEFSVVDDAVSTARKKAVYQAARKFLGVVRKQRQQYMLLADQQGRQTKYSTGARVSWAMDYVGPFKKGLARRLRC